MQKSLIVNGYWDSEGEWEDSTDKLNEYLLNGYKVVSVSPMGAFGFGFHRSVNIEKNYDDYSENGFASLVIIEKKMVEVKVMDLTTNREEYVILDIEIDKKMAISQMHELFNPGIVQHLKHSNFKILTYEVL